MNVTVDVNKVELSVQTNSASIEFEVHVNKSTVVDQVQSDLSETDESKKSFVLGKDEFAISNHNHSLANLTERSYNSLTDKPNLSLLEDIIDVQWWSDDVPEDVVEGDIYYSPLVQEIYVKHEIVWQQIPFD